MKVIHKLRMDLARCGCKPIVGAVQGEANTRVLEVDLFNNGIAWEIPEDTTVAVAFMKPDGTKGLYTRLPDDSPAATCSGSTVVATLAPQALTCAGTVLASLVFSDADGHTLATFPFKITVEVNPAAGEEASNDYYNPALPELYAAYEGLIDRIVALEEDMEGKIQEVTNEALAAAKASGEFDGPPGAPGEPGAPGPAYTLTETDKNTIAAAVEASLASEPLTFHYEDGTQRTIEVYVK